MMEKKEYIRPEVERIQPHEPIMLELPVSNGFVEDEAANSNNTFDQEESGGVTTLQLWDEE